MRSDEIGISQNIQYFQVGCENFAATLLSFTGNLRGGRGEDFFAPLAVGRASQPDRERRRLFSGISAAFARFGCDTGIVNYYQGQKRKDSRLLQCLPSSRDAVEGARRR